MKIGVIGSGNVGGTLGTRWSRNGHEVTFGSRKPDSQEMQSLAKGAGAKAAYNADTLKTSDIILLSTPWPATREVLSGLGDLVGKVVLDATNPLLPNLQGLEVGTNSSGGELVAQWAPGAKVVKIFNTVGFGIMADTSFGQDKPVMFYAGDDTDAKQTAKQLAEELGFHAVDAGPLSQARLLEPFALLWISLALVHGQGREMAFKLLKR